MIEVPYIKLAELCTVNQGLQIPISKRFKSEGLNRYFYITVQFLKDSHNEKFYVENPPKSSICNKDDIIVVRTGSTGQILTGIEGCFHNNFFKVNYDKEKVVGKYLYYCLKSKEKQKEMKNRSGITTIPDLNHFMFLDMKIPLPIYSQQKRIVKILDSINSKVEVNNKINQELEAMAKTLYDYWFVQFDFPDANGLPYKSSGGKMVFNEALKREIPEGWEDKKLSDFADCNKWNRTKENLYDKINYLDTSSLTENVIESFQELDFEKDKIPSRAQRIVSENDILYSTVRPNQLHYGIIKRPIENLIASTGFAQIRSNDSKITNDFIYQILSQDYVSTRLQQIAVGSVSAYPSISHNDIMELTIALPLKEELINKAKTIFQKYNDKIALNLEENQKLSELRDWLLPMLMNGQVTVGEVEQELGMVAEEKLKYGE
ncbi:restriction endonuclease subunit S [Cellulophaga lytica]|uniref:restriction endonuclease subunit S n=1 Tax=Cellulophaga lytica TaxID=979 RepID=UPI0032E4A187